MKICSFNPNELHRVFVNFMLGCTQGLTVCSRVEEADLVIVDSEKSYEELIHFHPTLLELRCQQIVVMIGLPAEQGFGKPPHVVYIDTTKDLTDEVGKIMGALRMAGSFP